MPDRLALTARWVNRTAETVTVLRWLEVPDDYTGCRLSVGEAVAVAADEIVANTFDGPVLTAALWGLLRVRDDAIRAVTP